MSTNPTSKQKDALQKLFNSGIDRANTMLNYLTEWPIRLQMSALEIFSPQQLHKKLEERVGMVQVSAMELIYRGEFEGNAMLVFPSKTVEMLVDTLADEQRRTIDRDAVKMKTISEVGNILLNGLMGSLSNVIKGGITYMAPSYKEGTLKELLTASDAGYNSVVLYGKTEFEIEQLQVKVNIILFFIVEPLETLLADIDRVIH